MKIIKLLLALFITFTFSCDTTEPPPPPSNGTTIYNTIILSVQWTDLYRINVKWNKAEADTLEPFTYRLTQTDEQGNKTTKEFIITGKDTSHTAGEPDSLLQSKTYWFNVEAYNGEEKLKDTSRTVEGKTLSPTSHDIVWQIDTLGQPGNFLYDVWGLDENNVYAVGFVDLPEGSSGIIKWDGSNWNVFPSFAGIKQGIFGFDENNIFVVGEFGSYGVVGRWDGSKWNVSNFFYEPLSQDTVWALRSVWGSSPEDVWAVGDLGTIIHWDGVEWRKVDAGITTRITSLWGVSQNEIYIVPISGINSSLYKYTGSTWEMISNNIGIFATSLWKTASGKLLIGGRMLLEYDGNNFNEIQISGRTRGIVKIKGSNVNNIFTAGDFGEINHYDGLSWKNIEDFEVPDGRYRVLYSVWCSEHRVFIVGVDENRAIIITGIIN